MKFIEPLPHPCYSAGLRQQEAIGLKSAGDTRAEALVSSYERAGYTRVAPPILQPAEPFLDLSGEDIRRRMYFVAEAGGEELCLRPDLTIPVAREYLAAAPHSGPQNYCYLGPVFRQGGGDSGEILQAGVESFGRNDADAADAETLALAFEAAASFGADRAVARTGDVALFSTLLDALDLAPVWKRRLAKDFNRKSDLAHDLERLFVKHTNGKPEYQGVFAAFANADPRAARALVTDLLSIAGISTVGGRTVGEIADRFLEQAELGAGSALPGEIQNVIERFLAITGALHDAAAQLRALAHDAGIALAPAIDRLETRTGFLVARSVDVRRISFATAFGRGLDYYTGFVFELHDPQNAGDGPLAAGGRYDGLLTRLGDGPSAPAVGFAAWIDRLAARAGRP